MRKTKFMMRCAKHAFVLAAIFVVSLCTASCSKDDDNSGKEAQGNYIIIDGKKYDLTIGVWNYSNGNRNRGYFVSLFADDEMHSDFHPLLVTIGSNVKKYNGKLIDLTQIEKQEGDFYSFWDVTCYLPGKKGCLFEANALKKYDNGLGDVQHFSNFASGTMRMTFDEVTHMFEIVIENAKVKKNINGDKKPHTLELRWKGVTRDRLY